MLFAGNTEPELLIGFLSLDSAEILSSRPNEDERCFPNIPKVVGDPIMRPDFTENDTTAGVEFPTGKVSFLLLICNMC